MKCVALAFLLSTALTFADDDDNGNVIKNGDFSEGISHWIGEGENVAEAEPELANRGMVFKLHSDAWVQATQSFVPKGSDFDFTITYKASPDLQFSTKGGDYQNVPGHLGLTLWQSFDIPVGQGMMLLGDFGDNVNGSYYSLAFDKSADGTSSFQTKFLGLSSRDGKTLTLAFPPGHGSVVILNVSMTPGKAPVITDTPDFTVTGEGATIQKLANGFRAYKNKGFVWQDIPDNLADYSYTQIDDTDNPNVHMSIHAKNDCVIQVATPYSSWDWPRTHSTSFSLTDKDHSTFTVYHRQLHAGEDFVLVQPLASYGVILLIPGPSSPNGNSNP